MRWSSQAVFVLLVASVLAVHVRSQDAFEVASIRRNVSGAGASFFRFEPDGSLRVSNTALRDIVRLAYYLDAYQSADWPRWMTEERYDIDAKAEGNPSQPQRIEMLRTLLADRFKLAMHTETREGPAYALVVAKGEHPKLRPSDGDCAPVRRPRQNEPLSACGLRVLPGRIVAAGVPIALLARTLAMGLERPVADETTLLWRFDIDLTFAPESFSTSVQTADAPPADTNAPAIFTALREQLGLALEPRRRPIDVYVIDHIERPSEN